MISSLTLSMLAAVTLAPTAPQETQDILSSGQARQAERYATVDNYSVVRSMGGIETSEYYEKIEVNGQPVFRLVPIIEYQGAVGEDGEPLTADELREIDKQMATQGGMETGLDMGDLMMDNAAMYRAAAEGVEEAEAEEWGRKDAARSVQGMAQFARRAKVVGTETIDGREAYVIHADDLSDIEMGQGDNEAQYTLQTMTAWIDTEELVMLRLKMDGILERDGQSRDMTIENLQQDYRQTGPLYESYRQVMRISGLMGEMSEKDRKDLEKAQKEMEEMEAQLDEMPASARSMVEGQMKKYRAMIDSMLKDGAIETTVDVVRIEVNQGPPVPKAN
jgi:hypothetical protein